MTRRASLTVGVCAAVAMTTGYLGRAQVRNPVLDPVPVTDAMLQGSRSRRLVELTVTHSTATPRWR